MQGEEGVNMQKREPHGMQTAGGKGEKKKLIQEREVERYLRAQVEKRGGLCLKVSPEHRRGMPDRQVILPGGLLVWVETKRPVGGRTSPAQRVAHLMLRRLGQRVELVATKEEADRLLAELTGRHEKTGDL